MAVSLAINPIVEIGGHTIAEGFAWLGVINVAIALFAMTVMGVYSAYSGKSTPDYEIKNVSSFEVTEEQLDKILADIEAMDGEESEENDKGER